MHLLITLLLLSIPLQSSEDLTHYIDVYYTEGFAHYTNKSDIPLRCQISAKIDPNLPFGTLAEKRNVTIRGHLSYTHNRHPYEQIILCYRLVEEKTYDPTTE